MSPTLEMLDHACSWQQGLAKGEYASQRAIARAFNLSQSTVSYALKVAQWPHTVHDFIRSHQQFISCKQLLDGARLPHQDSASLMPYFENILPSQPKKESTMSTATTLTLDTASAPPSAVHPKRPKSLIPSHFFAHLGLALVALAITTLGAWLTEKLYLDVTQEWRLFAAFAVLIVVGIILPLTAHSLSGSWQTLSWIGVAMGMVYSICLVSVANMHLGARQRIATQTAHAQIALLDQALQRLTLQQQEWSQAYLDEESEHYRHSAAAKKAERLGEQMVKVQQQRAKLQLTAQGYDPWMIFVDVIRQLVVELALVVVVCRWAQVGQKS